MQNFLRFQHPDPESLRAQIEQERHALRKAILGCDTLQILECTGNLGGMLTTDHQEAEAYRLLHGQLHLARQNPTIEASAWLIHSLATAAQYVGEYESANELFREVLQLAEMHEWIRLQHFVLHHWGRCLVEQVRFEEAEEVFQQALSIRQALGDARQQSTQRALAELRRLRQKRADA
ncbi:MAG TPA: tetratricopeptide repeat protein [Paucimonas sp.]|nr:tetratricopeptide repeat protein [Paucimonas sp.]